MHEENEEELQEEDKEMKREKKNNVIFVSEHIIHQFFFIKLTTIFREILT
jgi:hypothetical protein